MAIRRAKMDTRSLHVYEPSQCVRPIFWQAKDFATAPEGTAEAYQNSTKDRRWQKMPVAKGPMAMWSVPNVHIFFIVLPLPHRGLFFKHLSLYKTYILEHSKMDLCVITGCPMSQQTIQINCNYNIRYLNIIMCHRLFILMLTSSMLE